MHSSLENSLQSYGQSMSLVQSFRLQIWTFLLKYAATMHSILYDAIIEKKDAFFLACHSFQDPSSCSRSKILLFDFVYLSYVLYNENCIWRVFWYLKKCGCKFSKWTVFLVLFVFPVWPPDAYLPLWLPTMKACFQFPPRCQLFISPFLAFCV